MVLHEASEGEPPLIYFLQITLPSEEKRPKMLKFYTNMHPRCTHLLNIQILSIVRS